MVMVKVRVRFRVRVRLRVGVCKSWCVRMGKSWLYEVVCK